MTPSLISPQRRRTTVSFSATRQAASNGTMRPDAAWAAVIASAAPHGSLDTRRRAELIEVVVDVLLVGRDKPLPQPSHHSAHLHLLLEGWAYCYRTLRDGGRQISDILLPRDLCDEEVADADDASQGTRSCGVVRLAVLRRGTSDRADSALRTMVRGSRQAQALSLRNRLVSLGRRDARARVAYLLAELHGRLSRIGLTEGDAFECPLN